MGAGARLALCAALLAGASGCGRSVLNVGRTVAGVPLDSVSMSVVLIGDAGLPRPGGEPVLQALRRELATAPDRHFVVFLGDNIYPAGLADTLTEYGREGLRILSAQMEPLLETGTRGVFVPGNHDWEAGAPSGWNTIIRQERVINARGAGTVGMEPRGGCPGPVVLDIGEWIRVIALDSHWWLHGPGKPGAGSDCRPNTENGIVDSLRVALGTAGQRHTIVVAHHPVVSGGEHGGYFDWPTYLFPLHPWARLGGVFARQDISGREYRHMRAQLTRAFVARPPLVYAAGHEHNLQVMRREPARYLLVSGGGIYGHNTPSRAITGTQYTRAAAGWMSLTVLRDGRMRLSVVVVDADGTAREDYSDWLVPVAPAPPGTPNAGGG